MTKLRQYWLIIVIVLILLAGYFYWFQWRPNQITKQCNKEAVEKAKEPEAFNQAIKIYDALYKSCLREKGLK